MGTEQVRADRCGNCAARNKGTAHGRAPYTRYECRRFPPVVQPDKGDVRILSERYWPLVTLTDWCLEYLPEPAPTEPPGNVPAS